MTTILKLGGELLEDSTAMRTAAEAIAQMSAEGPLAVVHGGGRAIDADLRARGKAPRFVDGLRVTGDRLPEIKHVAHTNFCDVGWKLDEATGRLIVVVCLDNLVKGAAGQAVQNFNLAFGLDERTGLL